MLSLNVGMEYDAAIAVELNKPEIEENQNLIEHYNNRLDDNATMSFYKSLCSLPVKTLFDLEEIDKLRSLEVQ